MQRLLEMCEVVKKQGIVANGDQINPAPFWEYIGECQPFVFSLSGETLAAPEVKDADGNIIDIEYDAPFKVFSIEVLNGFVTVPEEDERDLPTTIRCIMVVEYEPRDYVYYAHLSAITPQGLLDLVMKTDQLDGLAVKFIERMNREKCGTEHVRERIKIGTGKLKRTITIRRIVHVRPKRDQVEVNESTGRHIEWTHRWWRRGHWRDIKGLGKDRLGVYSVAGKTWVMEHTAGAPDGVVVKKVRVVED